jgi:hypothetical protein
MGMYLIDVYLMNVPLVGLSRGPLSRACICLRPKACVLCLRPKSLCPLPPPQSLCPLPPPKSLRPLPLSLPLPQSLGAPSAHCLSRAIMLF